MNGSHKALRGKIHEKKIILSGKSESLARPFEWVIGYVPVENGSYLAVVKSLLCHLPRCRRGHLLPPKYYERNGILEMKRIRKQVWSLLLTVALILTQLPTTAYAATEATVEYEDENGVSRTVTATVLDGSTVTLEGSTTNGWYVAMGDLTINQTITVNGDVKLILATGCSLEVIGNDGAGINVTGTNRLSIYGQPGRPGTLNATGESSGAGIGGSSEGQDGGIITIYGGTVNASGGSGAGIGGAYGGGAGGIITIYGGTVNATSHRGAGIGSGGTYYNDNDSNGGIITIYGGTVTATSDSGAGIGGGDAAGRGGSGGTITIYGGSVKATSLKGAGIGVGDNGDYDDRSSIIIIYDGTVDATSNGETGIGGGKSNVTIYDGSVNATSNIKAGIGGINSTITIHDATVTANSIGGTYSTVVITGENTTPGTIIQNPDNTNPTIQNFTPGVAGAPINGNIVITFSEAMRSSYGTVTADNNIGTLTGSWDIDRKVYTVPYTGLNYSTLYTVTLSGFKDAAGNTMTDDSRSFTTENQPLSPSVSPNALTVRRGDTGSFTISFGQGVTAVSGAAITIADSTIASVDTVSLVSPGAITVIGHKAGTTDITVTFNDTTPTTATVSVTVETVTPVWSSGSTLTASEVTHTGAVLTWAGVQDASEITGYKLYKNGTELALVAGNVSQYTVTGLSASTSYLFEVQAVNVDGIWTTNGPSVTVTMNAYSFDTGTNNSTDTKAIIPQPEGQPDYPVITGFEVMSVVDNHGHAVATISESELSDAIKKAQSEAMAQGKTSNGIGIVANLKLPDTATSLGVTLDRAALQKLVDTGVKEFHINSEFISLKLDLMALKELLSKSTGDVTITVKPVDHLLDEAKELIGTRPVYDITISYVKDGETVDISSLGQGTAALSIPYSPDEDEATGYLSGIYVDSKGYATRIGDSVYDENAGSILASTDHFSIFGIGYMAPANRFTDTSMHWAKEAIDYVVSRGLLTGSSDTTFSPNKAITRGMLATALGRLANVDTNLYKVSSFTDVKTESTYQPYIEWAYKKGILQGIGGGEFAPDRTVTREEVAIIFVNYAKVTGYTLPITRKLNTFADYSSIGRSYQAAVKTLQQAGILMGGSENAFNPQAIATRGEVSTMLYRYIKLTIASTTAQGWALDDAGQYLYFRDGKALTGWQKLAGSSYYFEENGVLKTGWVKDGNKWRYYNRNKAVVGWQTIRTGKRSHRYYFTEDGFMVSNKWLRIGGKWYYFYPDGYLAVNTTIDGYKIDKNGVRKTKSK